MLQLKKEKCNLEFQKVSCSLKESSNVASDQYASPIML